MRGHEVEVCLYCGTTEPRVPVAGCAHGKTVRVSSSAALRLAAELAGAVQGVETYRVALAEVVARESDAGRASVDECPPVRSPGENVIFLVRRDELVNERGEPLPIEKIYPRGRSQAGLKGARRASQEPRAREPGPVRETR